jgi:hypothetical protein
MGFLWWDAPSTNTKKPDKNFVYKPIPLSERVRKRRESNNVIDVRGVPSTVAKTMLEGGPSRLEQSLPRKLQKKKR